MHLHQVQYQMLSHLTLSIVVGFIISVFVDKKVSLRSLVTYPEPQS